MENIFYGGIPFPEAHTTGKAIRFDEKHHDQNEGDEGIDDDIADDIADNEFSDNPQKANFM